MKVSFELGPSRASDIWRIGEGYNQFKYAFANLQNIINM